MIILVLTTSCDKNKTIYVASTLADCKNNPSEKCLQVKENIEDEWTVLDNDIEGFEHKDGFMQKIEVKISKIKDPAPGASAFNYKYLKLIYEKEEQLQKVEEVPFSVLLDKNHSGKWQVNTLVGMDSLTIHPVINFKNGSISGNAGCNNYGATFNVSGNSITFSLGMVTKMYCTNMPIEKAYFDCLAKAKTYELADKLTFYDANNVELMSCSKLEE